MSRWVLSLNLTDIFYFWVKLTSFILGKDQFRWLHLIPKTQHWGVNVCVLSETVGSQVSSKQINQKAGIRFTVEFASICSFMLYGQKHTQLLFTVFQWNLSSETPHTDRVCIETDFNFDNAFSKKYIPLKIPCLPNYFIYGFTGAYILSFDWHNAFGPGWRRKLTWLGYTTRVMLECQPHTDSTSPSHANVRNLQLKSR